MTPQQQQLIRETWAMVDPIADAAASIFYKRLFELDPSIAKLFAATDMAAQRKNLMQTLAVVVKSIDRLDNVVPAVEHLGRRHVTYGVQPAHFATVGQALLDTLAIGLGDAFTDDVREAWATAYGILASVMQSAGETAEAAAA
jgi:hemoglobin-like flavoprotein